MKKYDKLLKLKTTNSVCLIGHIDPDADALASMVVFRDFLKTQFQIDKVDIFAEASDDLTRYEEILGNVKINNEQQSNYQTAIMLDSPNLVRLGKYKDLFVSAKNKYVIDHHATNEHCGEVNIVEMCSSTCEIVYSILKHFKFKISKQNQGKLYAGIITDTNNFTVGNFGKRTFKIASDCVENINKTEIYNHFLASTSLKQMQVISIAINNISSFINDQIILSHISTEEAEKWKASPEDCSGIINKLATISGCKLVCFIYPNKNQYYVSMRAKEGYDVATIAKENGGGGHKGASAYLSNKTLYEIKEDILKQFTQQLKLTKTLNKILF